MAGSWIVQLCCRACGQPIELGLDDLAEGAVASRVPCAAPACDGHAEVAGDLPDLARFMFEESQRRLAAGADPVTAET
jgi:hypothetical protein